MKNIIIPMADGTIFKPDRLEHPFIFYEDGKPMIKNLSAFYVNEKNQVTNKNKINMK